jgi:hypothetical protein
MNPIWAAGPCTTVQPETAEKVVVLVTYWKKSAFVDIWMAAGTVVKVCFEMRSMPVVEVVSHRNRLNWLRGQDSVVAPVSWMVALFKVLPV